MIKRPITLLFFLFWHLFAFSQMPNFVKIDAYAREAPDSEAQSIERLSKYLVKPAANDLEKVRALYVWMTENVRYDTKLFFDEKLTPERKAEKQLPEKVLKYKKAVCEGYSNLFHELCLASNVQAEKVSGFTKNLRGRVSRTGHAWNAVKIEEDWYLVDNTWGAGYIDDKTQRFQKQFEEKYFLAKPETFVLDHYPNDPLFQLLPNPISWEIFQQEVSAIEVHLSNQNEGLFTHYKDSLTYFHELDSTKKIFNSAYRILAFDPQNGYANYLIANYHYDESRKDFNVYRKATEEVVHNPRRLKKSQLEQWDRILDRSKEKLYKSKEYLERIESTNQYYRIARQARKNVNAALINIRNANKQMGQFRDYLKRKN